MVVKAGYLTPLLHVADVERSLRFYELLGFETVDLDGEGGSIGWARVHCKGGAIMFLQEEKPVQRRHDRFLLYLYVPDLPALREQLIAAGVEVGPIRHPGYMRNGEISLKDPDQYTILVGHWSQQEDEEWETKRKTRLSRRSEG